MPRLLCIAYHFPPSYSVGGSLRSAGFARYLPSYGWDVTVLALREGLGGEHSPDVVRVPSLLPWRQPFNLSPYGWLPSLFVAAWLVLRKRHHDAIYVSCPPFGFVPAVAWLKRVSGLPLIVDFRDAWTTGPYRSSSRVERFLGNGLFRRMERRLLRSADQFVVNTPSAVKAYLAQYPWLAGRLHYIPNGYNGDIFPDFRPFGGSPAFTLLHGGPFDVSGRDPSSFLAALRMLRDEGVVVHLKVLGEAGGRLREQARSWGIEQQVELFPSVSHQEALGLLQQCDALLLYQARSEAAVTAVAGKTYEYIRSEKPIMVVAPPGDNRRLVEHYAGYFVIARDHEPEAIAACIRRLVRARQEGKLPVRTPPKPGFEHHFERRAQTRRLARLLDRTLRKSRQSSRCETES